MCLYGCKWIKPELRHHQQSFLPQTSLVLSATGSLELRLVSSAILEHTNNNTSHSWLGLVIVSNDRRTNKWINKIAFKPTHIHLLTLSVTYLQKPIIIACCSERVDKALHYSIRIHVHWICKRIMKAVIWLRACAGLALRCPHVRTCLILRIMFIYITESFAPPNEVFCFFFLHKKHCGISIELVEMINLWCCNKY